MSSHTLLLRSVPLVVLVLVGGWVAPAIAAPATSQTQHFSTLQSWGTPSGSPTNATNCTGPVGNAFINDFVDLDFTGNGVQHVNVNGAGDSWFTTTFTGTGTATFYPPSSLDIVFDDQGNVVGTPAITGPADMIVAARVTQWFGFEDNRNNAVGHGTVNARGVTQPGALVPAGQSVAFHDVTSARWPVGTDPSGPPSVFTNQITCP